MVGTRDVARARGPGLQARAIREEGAEVAASPGAAACHGGRHRGHGRVGRRVGRLAQARQERPPVDQRGHQEGVEARL